MIGGGDPRHSSTSRPFKPPAVRDLTHNFTSFIFIRLVVNKLCSRVYTLCSCVDKFSCCEQIKDLRSSFKYDLKFKMKVVLIFLVHLGIDVYVVWYETASEIKNSFRNFFVGIEWTSALPRLFTFFFRQISCHRVNISKAARWQGYELTGWETCILWDRENICRAA